ncbi:MAG TPA: hypothetical protein VN802_10810 [Stellaceae bacterium]|nr:hypothetical protein [Stellaceae bacterium]
MRYPTPEQRAGAAAQRSGPTFGLRPRAVEFAHLYAEHPFLGSTKAALMAGYARRCPAGAHVRANELLRDPRVRRAVAYFGGRALAEAMGKARRGLDRIAQDEGRFWNTWDRNAFDRLTNELKVVEQRLDRLEETERAAEGRRGLEDLLPV